MDEERERFTELGCMRGTIIWGSLTVIALALGLFVWSASHQDPSPHRMTAGPPAIERSQW